MKSKLLSLCCVLAALTGPVTADACDCTIVPFEPRPPCDSICPTQILSVSKKRELVNVLGLSEKLADKIAKVKDPNSIKLELTKGEQKEIQSRIQLLDQAKVRALMATLPADVLKDVDPNDKSLKEMRVYQETNRTDEIKR